MTDISPLRQSDPADIGGFALLGRLREDERGPAYLARDAGGRHVEITWLRGGADGFDRVAAALTAAGGTPSLARVVATGVRADRPYVVSEHVPGRPLHDVVAAGGALTGTALHRLAIAMASALTGLHQNGVTHGDLRPGTVLVGAEGVRLTGYGLAGLGDAGPAETTHVLGRVAYAAPEQVTGSGGGAAADVFAWAATLLYAATGAPPFEGASMAETVNRVARHQPELDVLEEHLRPVVGACLAKDPLERPDAGEVLLRLVGHSTQSLIPDALPSPEPAGPDELTAPESASHADGAAGSPVEQPGHSGGDRAPEDAEALEEARAHDPAGTRPAEAEPGAGVRGVRWWRGWAGLAAGGVVVAVVSAGAGHLIADRVSAARPGVTPSPTLSLPDMSVTAAGPRALPSPAATTRATGITLALHEHPDDPQRIVAYLNKDGAWLRTDKGGGFTEAGVAAEDVAASPDGARLALQDGRDVTIVERRTGERYTVRIPGRTAFPVWDRASSRLLFTVDGPKRTTAGFAVLDTATRQTRTVPTEGDTGPYAWTPGGDGVVASHDSDGHTGLRFRDLNGREVRAMPWTGPSAGRGLFSPSGRLMLTTCPSGGTQCAWDAVTGVRVATYVNTIKGAEMWGWYDDDHLMIMDPGRTPHEFVAVDFREGTRRVLATLEAADDTADLRLARAAR